VAHQNPAFAEQIQVEGLDADEVADQLIARIRAGEGVK
jgi:hypothetical protein